MGCYSVYRFSAFVSSSLLFVSVQPLLTGRYALQLLTVSLMLLCIPLEEFAIGIAAQVDETTTMFDLKTVSLSAMTIIVSDRCAAV